MAHARRTTYRPRLEPLENRELPAVSVVLDNGTLLVRGGNAAERVVVFFENGQIIVTQSGVGRRARFAAAAVDEIVFRGRGGNDLFINNTFLPSTAVGDDGDDTLQGGAALDRLFGNVETPTLRVRLPDGPGGDYLLDRLRYDWGPLGLEVARASSAASADLAWVDEVAPSSSPSWFLRRFRCGIAATNTHASTVLSIQRNPPAVRVGVRD